MTDASMASYLLDRLNIYHTCDKRDNFWVIETADFQFWFDEKGELYETITKIPKLEDC